MSAPLLVFTLDPQGLALWLTPAVADALRASRGSRLTREQWESDAVQELLELRRQARGVTAPARNDLTTMVADALGKEHR